ncbi:type II secretion system minor pseudopilin GspI [Marinospirillum insulare]|uniref:Type II secretion system protein I n=1 Tax=Marinospirillum insulare TaxID=217169 RepID=A0ABQ5ZXM1_9GAMM|nr:type II secretion system minor pseudopilin GspI [Marinospirillum insulare]GLR63082.1 hypothetical protein GCM10007878_05170 [Marinospirillum insulare]
MNKLVTKNQQGLTLVEVLVALFILAMMAAIAVQVVSRAADVRQASEERALAQLCADNLLVEWMLATEWPEVGQREGEAAAGAMQCFWRVAIQATPLPTMRRVDIEVYAEAKRENLLTQVSGFVGNK